MAFQTVWRMALTSEPSRCAFSVRPADPSAVCRSVRRFTEKRTASAEVDGNCVSAVWSAP